MKKTALVLGLLATPGVWVADVLLLTVPVFRNGWATLPLFLAPLLLVLLGKGAEKAGKLAATAWVVLLLGGGGWIAMRVFWGGVEGTPAVASGDRAPNFTLKNQDGRDASLSDVTDQGRVLLVFFRGSG